MARHKSILFVGSDIALTASDPAGYCAAFIYPARDRLTRALDEANVTFHVVDPRGLESFGNVAESEAPVEHTDMGTNMLREMTLAILPDYTGGRTVASSNKPADAIERIFEEDRAYYVLAVARDPAAAGVEDRQQIKITVKRSDATVHARNVYFAADSAAGRKAAPSAAAAALNELLPRADFPLQMNLVPQFSQDGSPEIRVLLGVASEVAGKLDVLIGAFDRTFKPAGDPPLKQRLDVPASAVAGGSAFQWATLLKPPPGDYEVRAAVATADGKRAASVIGYVDVPDVGRTGFALSGVVVKSGAARLRCSVSSPPAPGSHFPFRSRARRTSGAMSRCVTRSTMRSGKPSRAALSHRLTVSSRITTSAFACRVWPVHTSRRSRRVTARVPGGVTCCSPFGERAGRPDPSIEPSTRRLKRLVTDSMDYPCKAPGH